MLFAIQWLGGVYCAKKLGWDDDDDILIWVICIFIGWIFIVFYIYDIFVNSSTSTSTKTDNNIVPLEQAQDEDNPNVQEENIQDANRSPFDYEKEFKNTGKYANAGVVHDLKRHIIEGGGFWYTGDVLRHIGGKNHVYQAYYSRIESAFNYQGREEAANVAAEAAEYARQKGDMLQYWGFLFEEALCVENLRRIVNISISVCDYCIEQNKAIPPKWYYENGLTICNVHYLALKITDNSKTRDNFTALFDTVFFLIDTDKIFKDFDRLEEDYYYLGLLIWNMDRFKKASTTFSDIKQQKDELVHMIKRESSNYNTLVNRWAKEGVSFE